MRYHVLAAVMLAGVAACSRNEPTDSTMPARVSLHPAQAVDAAGVSVTLIRVDNESRCPGDVMCVWAGDATVVLTVRTPGSPPATLAQQFVHISADPRFVDVGEYRVQLDSLKPYPVSTHAIEQKDYVAFVTVSSKPASK